MSNSALQSAYTYCRRITFNHAENFPVASIIVPARLRNPICAIYAFARHADDLADVHRDAEALERWRRSLHAYPDARRTESPIFLALFDTIRRFRLPLSLLDDLLTAFFMDVRGTEFPTLQEALHYCRYSAHPIGRLILLLFGYRDPALFSYSDAICTALQFTNFWQDVRIDIPAGRMYIPHSLRKAYGVDERDLRSLTCTPAFRSMMSELVHITTDMFRKGRPLLARVHGRLRKELQLTVAGGMTLLKQIEKQNFDVLSRRPRLNRRDWIRIFLQTWTH